MKQIPWRGAESAWTLLTLLAVLSGSTPAEAASSTLEVVNPSGEINGDVDGAAISDPAVLGWSSDGGVLSRGGIDYGNGAWRFVFEDSQEVHQMTPHAIELGAAYSLRFDASIADGTLSSRVIVAELWVDVDGTPTTVASRTFDFKTLTHGAWDHYHLAALAGSLDAHVGETLGIRFRSDDSGVDEHVSFDNVRLDVWPAGAPDGSFSDDWDNTPNQVWIGPGYWANRLQDWEVQNGRVNCLQGSHERRTVHLAGTSIRASGGDFSFSVRTGLHAGGLSSSARAGLLIGAGPNLDWRGSILVQDELGRDFGVFLGLTGDGEAVIEDYTDGTLVTLDEGTAAGLEDDTRLDVTATYDPVAGTYDLTVSAFDDTEQLLSTASASVPSDVVLGSFGLLSHRGTGSARFWFDDFSGTGTALQAEEDRHLAILGAMHMISDGTLRVVAQLSPLYLLSLEGGPTVNFEIFEGGGYQNIQVVQVDNTDGVSSYTATFTLQGWNVFQDTDYRLRVKVQDVDYFWYGTIQEEPTGADELVIAATNCQRFADQRFDQPGVEWTPVDIWQPHPLAYGNIEKHDPDLFLAVGDQVYEFLPSAPDLSSDSNLHLDYLYKWYVWVLQARDLLRNVPAIVIPDDHDVFQGNIWGEGGIPTAIPNEGGYVHPPAWVKMVERTQTSNLPDGDPYNVIQPAPPVAQGIGVYFTGVVFGRVGFAVLEDRKFKTGPGNPPPTGERHLLGDRQHDFLRAWATDWEGHDLKLAVSQSPLGNLRTHAGTGYSFSLNDKDTHGWPLRGRNAAWQHLRLSRMFQIGGDQHLATVAHHGVDSPRDAGFSFAVPATSNFFPRTWDPVNNAAGTTTTVSPNLGDYFFDGNGTLPDGVTPNLTAQDPAHMALRAVGNPLEYYEQVSGIDPANLHDRGAGYGIIRLNPATRQITFEAWPLHVDPEFPQTGSQFAGWPITLVQTDNDGRVPTGYLPVIDTGEDLNPVISIYDEADSSLLYGMRIRGNQFRPPVFNNGTTYRAEIALGDDPVSQVLPGLVPTVPGPPTIVSFSAHERIIARGESSTLRWNVESPTTLTIDQGIGDVSPFTVDGIGSLSVSPTVDTTYTLTLDGGQTATATVVVFPANTLGRPGLPPSKQGGGKATTDVPR